MQLISKAVSTNSKKQPIANKVKTSKNSSSALISREKIAERAFRLWQSRGGLHGDDLNDWLTAEQELSVLCAKGSK
ncbi:MAG: DUF2934 domain-containing protein [Candidatus Obscuribacterales bacterium]|jgi:hypothetical protein|nr:DUF2934 domain-containing protein [Candidatus Obscuribacterales bacterium]